MSLAHDGHSMQRSRRERDARDYRWVFWTAFPFFLAATVARRMLPGRGPMPAVAARPRLSVFREAWIAANSAIPFAFMN
jgi:hypothetical protein